MQLPEVKARLELDRDFLEKSILAIYSRQTPEEKECKETIEKNYIGFNAIDAKRVGYMAKWIKDGNHLSGRHLEGAESMMQKYAKQVMQAMED